MSADRNCRGLDAFMKFSVAKQRLKIMKNSMINFTISNIDNITTAYSNVEELAVLQNKYTQPHMQVQCYIFRTLHLADMTHKNCMAGLKFRNRTDI